MNTPTCGEISCEECDNRTAALTAERDQLRVDLELADVMYQRECEVEHELRTEVERLRADRTYNHECINRLAVATGTLGEKSEKVVDVVLSTIDQLHARAERAEDNLAALEQCHDDNCRGAVKFADELASEREKVRRLRLALALAAHDSGELAAVYVRQAAAAILAREFSA